MRVSAYLGLAASLLVANCSATASAEDAPAYLKKDLQELTDLFAGRWDNDRHVFFAEDAGMPGENISPRQHLIIQPIESDDDNSLSFAAKRKIGDAEITLTHTFSISSDNLAIEQNTVGPNGETCQFSWRRGAGGFEAQGGEGCNWMFAPPGDTSDISVHMNLSPNEIWVQSKRNEDVNEARFRRARPFSCWVSVLRGETHGTTGENNSDWFFQRGVMLHDQYGEAIVETDESPPRKISLRLRNVDWPYGRNRPSLTLYIHEAGNDRAVSYAWAEYDAGRIGINLRWIQASCTHSPKNLYDF